MLKSYFINEFFSEMIILAFDLSIMGIDNLSSTSICGSGGNMGSIKNS